MIETAVGAYQEMKEGYIVTLQDDAGEIIGFWNPGDLIVQTPEEAQFTEDRLEARQMAASAQLNLPQHEATVRKAIVAIQVDGWEPSPTIAPTAK